jgi:photosystem II stability/assembly factor-like uncharacterized protein
MTALSSIARRASLLGGATSALCLVLGATAPSGGLAARAAAAQSFSAVAFANAQVGWAGGEGGILATRDAGSTWQRQYSGPAAILSFSALSPSTAWAVAADRLLGTTDGGRHWTRLGEPSSPLATVDFVSPAAGWGVTAPRTPFGAGTLVHSIDGGLHWQRIASPSSVNSVCFSDPRSGWAGSQKTILHTTDGGKTWRVAFKAPLGQGESDWTATVGCAGGGVAWVQFAGAGGGMMQSPFVVYHTADGGTHWSAALEEGYFNSLYPTAHAPENAGGYGGPFAVAGEKAAYFLTICAPCNEGALIVTATQDGGRTWRQSQVTALPTGQVGVAFPSAKSGWLAGVVQRMQGPSTILHTADAAHTWVRQYPR